MTTETPPRPRRRTQPDPSLPKLSAIGWVQEMFRKPPDLLGLPR